MAKIKKGAITIQLDIEDMLHYIINDIEVDQYSVFDTLNHIFDLNLDSHSLSSAKLDIRNNEDCIIIELPETEE